MEFAFGTVNVATMSELYKQQVLWSVVVFYSIDVMDGFMCLKMAPNHLFHDQSMLWYVAVLVGGWMLSVFNQYLYVAAMKKAPTFPVVCAGLSECLTHAMLRAKRSAAIFRISQPGRSHEKSISTYLACAFGSLVVESEEAFTRTEFMYQFLDWDGLAVSTRRRVHA